MPPPPRRTVTLEASVLSARGLVSTKGEEEPVSSLASIALLDADVVESELVEESSEPTFTLSTSTTFKADDASCLKLLSTPLSVSLFEGADKAPLGTATVSLEPLMQSASLGEVWVPLMSEEGEATGGEVLVTVSGALPLMSEEDWAESTILTFNLLSMHCLPSRWGIDAELASEADHTFTYTAVGSFLGEELAYTGVAQPPPPPPEPVAEAPAADASVEASALGEAPADAPAADGAAPAEAPAAEPPPPPDPQEAAEAAAGAITFSGPSLRKFLGPEATAALRSAIAAGEAPLTFTIGRVTKAPETTYDSNALKYAATCAAVPAGVLAVDAHTSVDRLPIAPMPPPEEPLPAPEEGKGKPVPTEVEEEEAVHPYLEAKTYLKMGFELTNPLTPKPEPPPPPLPAVAELVPKRVLPQFAHKTAAVEFDGQVKSIVESMVGEWSSLFPDLDLQAPADDASKEDRRRALLYALNTSGKYWMFKERLKRSVVRLVKDTMARPSSEPLDSAAMELFYNDLYVTLTKRLHASLNGLFYPPTEAPPAPSLPNAPEPMAAEAALGTLAQEMEAAGDLASAATYHKERVATGKYGTAAWLAYAGFLMRTNDAPTAEEASREAVALAPSSAEALLAHGAILASRGDYEHAEVFLKAHLDAAMGPAGPGDATSWLLMALLYAQMGRPRDQRTATKQARQLHGDDLGSAYIALAKKLLPLNAAPLVTLALQTAEEASGGASGELLICRGELQLYTDAAAAVATLSAGLELARKSAHGFELCGSAHLRLGDAASAQAAFERALELSPQPYPVGALLKLGALCLDAGDADGRAKELYLYACRQSPSATSWLGAGIACLRLGELPEAEEALAEANVLNNRHPRVWGQLALLCLRQGREAEASQALEQAYKLHLTTSSDLLSLSTALLASGMWRDAEGAARRTLLASPASAAAQKALGDALTEQHSYEAALAAYQAGIAAGDEGACKAAAATLLTTHLNRPGEAAAL